jgi:type II secretory pathway component PulF
MNYGSANNPGGKAGALAQAALRRTADVPRDPHADKTPPSSSLRRQVSRKDLVAMTSQLAIMTRSGVDVSSALQSLVRQQKSPAFRAILAEVHDTVLAGTSLSQALSKYPRAFNGTYVASVAAGEASGQLSEVLSQLAALLRSQMKLANSLRAMMAYPVMLSGVSGLVLLALLLFVLPKFETIFADFEAPLPAITRVLLAISAELRHRFWLWGPALLTWLAGAILFLRSQTGRQLWDRAVLHLYVLRDVTRNLLIGRTCRLLGIMIDSGVPLLESLALVRNSVKNSLYRRLFDRLEDDVVNGRGLATALLESEFVPGAAAEMVVTAEKTGTLGSVTRMIGEHYEEEGEARLKELVAVAEPAITVVMGLVVAVIVMSVMLPLFDLSSAVKGG